jgi:hypothetical protein
VYGATHPVKIADNSITNPARLESKHLNMLKSVRTLCAMMKGHTIRQSDLRSVKKTYLDSTLTQCSPSLFYAARVNLPYLLEFMTFQLLQLRKRNEKEARGIFF